MSLPFGQFTGIIGAKLVSWRNVLRMPYSAALVTDLRDPCAVSTVALEAQERLA